MLSARLDDSTDGLTELAVKIRELSRARWGAQRNMSLLGLHPLMLDAQHRLLVSAQADTPVLITGETGTGKELFARAMHLLSRRRAAPYLCVNCAQYQDGQLIASELFGHRRGSFTGAVSDHRGIFEEAESGIVFLDEIAELSPMAQAMLLRTLGEGEILPVGDSRPRPVNVRVFAATSRDLKEQVARGLFREDLYYRLRYLQVRVPALRDRGDDWEIIATTFLRQLGASSGTVKELTPDAVRVLRTHDWPGNVRELLSVIESAFHVSAGPSIDSSDFAGELESIVARRVTPLASHIAQTRNTPVNALSTMAWDSRHREGGSVQAIYRAMVVDRSSFWLLVYEPFMARDLTRADARAVVEHGLWEARGSYKRLLIMFGIESADYLRFMDFLRHHRLKPSRAIDPPTDAVLPLSHGAADWEMPPGIA